MSRFKGMTLVEVILAVGILGIVLITSSVAFSMTYASIYSAGRLSEGTYITQNKMEENISDYSQKADASYDVEYDLFSDYVGADGKKAYKLPGSIEQEYMGVYNLMICDGSIAQVTNQEYKKLQNGGVVFVNDRWISKNCVTKVIDTSTQRVNTFLTNKETKPIVEKSITDKTSDGKIKVLGTGGFTTVYGNPRESLLVLFDQTAIPDVQVKAFLYEGVEEGTGILSSSKGVRVSSIKPSSSILKEFKELANNDDYQLDMAGSDTFKMRAEGDFQPGKSHYMMFRIDFDQKSDKQLKPGRYTLKFSFYKDDKIHPYMQDEKLVYNVKPIESVAGTKDGRMLVSHGDELFYEIEERNNAGGINHVHYAKGNAGESFFVAGGNGGYFKYSSDGLNWKDVNIRDLGSYNIIKIVTGGKYDDRKFIAIANHMNPDGGSRIYISHDSKNSKKNAENPTMKWENISMETSASTNLNNIALMDIEPVIDKPYENKDGKLISQNPNYLFYLTGRMIRGSADDSKVSFFRLGNGDFDGVALGNTNWRLARFDSAGNLIKPIDKILVPPYKIYKSYKTGLAGLQDGEGFTDFIIGYRNDANTISANRIYEQYMPSAAFIRPITPLDTNTYKVPLSLRVLTGALDEEGRTFVYAGGNRWIYGFIDDKGTTIDNTTDSTARENRDYLKDDEYKIVTLGYAGSTYHEPNILVEDVRNHSENNNKEIQFLTNGGGNQIIACLSDKTTYQNPEFYYMFRDVTDSGRNIFRWLPLGERYDEKTQDGNKNLNNTVITAIDWRS